MSEIRTSKLFYDHLCCAPGAPLSHLYQWMMVGSLQIEAKNRQILPVRGSWLLLPEPMKLSSGTYEITATSLFMTTTSNKRREWKACLSYREGRMIGRRGEGYSRKKNHCIKMFLKIEQTWEWRNNWSIGKKTRNFCVVFQWKRWRWLHVLRNFKS